MLQMWKVCSQPLLIPPWLGSVHNSAFMGFTFPSFFKGKGIKKFLPAGVWFVAVMILMFTPGPDLPKLDDWFHRIYGDKWVHIGAFGLLAFLFMYPLKFMSLTAMQKSGYITRIAIATSVWGYTTECIQGFFIPGRSYDLLDWAADSVGILIALIYTRKLIKTVH